MERAERNWVLQAAQNGETTARCDPGAASRYIHSRIDPGAEALRWAERLRGATGDLVVLGFGLGYHVRSILQVSRFERITVVEKDRVLFDLASKAIDRGAWPSGPALQFLVGQEPADAVRQLAVLCRPRPFSLLQYHPVTRLDEAYYRVIRSALEGELRERRTLVDPQLSGKIDMLLEQWIA